jgi:hypothetical protein
MNGLIQHKNIILKVAILILFFQTILFANTGSICQNSYSSSELISKATLLQNTGNSENIEISLDSFGSMSMIIMLILTSLVGTFFVKDEFPKVF